MAWKKTGNDIWKSSHGEYLSVEEPYSKEFDVIVFQTDKYGNPKGDSKHLGTFRNRVQALEMAKEYMEEKRKLKKVI
jgi:hypothetical protein